MITKAQQLAKQWYYAGSKRRAVLVDIINASATKSERFGDDIRLHFVDGSMLLHRVDVDEYI